MTVTDATASPTTPEDLASLVEEIWASLLGQAEPLLPAPDPGRGTDRPGGATWSAQVEIDGDWHGTVRVDLEQALALALAEHMLGPAGTDPVDDADLADAIGELANVVGGNVKSLLPGDGHLSLPSVGRGVPDAGTVPVCRTDHSWAGHRLSVRLLGAPSPAAPHRSRENR